MSKLSLLFNARSIAVIGASSHPEKVGHQVLKNLVRGNEALEHARERRKLFPINPAAKKILGLPVFPSLSMVMENIEVVIIATPAPTVPGLVDEIISRNALLPAAHQTKGVVIITAGFAEEGKKGNEIQAAIAQKLHDADIALLGPNTLGYIYSATQLNASFANHSIPDGNIALISQSGAMLTALFDALQNGQVGVSFAVSLGNKAGINENDCLEYALNDKATRVVALYLESFHDLPHFFELANRVSKQKPVLLLKGGVSERGQAASVSHTAALATNQVLLAAAAQQMGFILLNNIEELLSISFFLSRHRQAPENVMVITNAGGPGVNTIDELAAHGVQLAQWSAASKEALDEHVPRSKPNNPLDLLGDAQPENYRAAIQIAQRDMNIESLLLIVTPQAVTDMKGIVETIITHKGRKPMFVTLIGGEHLEPLRQKLRDANITAADFPTQLIEILETTNKVCRNFYQKEQFYAGTHSTQSQSGVRQPSLEAAFTMLTAFGFQVPKYWIVNKNTLANIPANAFPLFAKTANLSLLHKKEMGAIYGVVKDTHEAATAFQKMSMFGDEVLFQEVVDIDHELLLGYQHDEQFGPFVTIGLGGSYTNVLADRAYVFLPTTAARLQTAWSQTKAATALKELPAQSKKVVENMAKLQKMIIQNPWLKSLEINPLVVNAKGVWVADVKVGV